MVLVSLDPERDTAALLAKTHDERSLGRQWTLLRTDRQTTRTLAAALGVRYRDNGDGSIEHTSKIVLLDQDGVVAATRDAIGSDVSIFVGSLHALLNKASPGSVAPPRKL